MSSSSLLLFDDVEIDEWREHVPDEVIALFQEPDRDPKSYDEHSERICYSATRDVILQRLDVMGITSEVAADAFENWKEQRIELLGDIQIKVDDEVDSPAGSIRTLSYWGWQQRVPAALAARFGPPLADSISAKMQDLSEDWMPFGSHDYRAALRAMLDAAPNVQAVTLDVSALIRAGYFDPDLCIALQLRAESDCRRPVLESIVIIAEGSFDIRTLQISLRKLYPHLDYYFSFFDHEELNVDGGAEYLVKFIKAFATSGMYVRMIAVFDNDAAGVAAAAKARALSLPSRIQILTLPDTDIAREYPTIGPQGEHNVDINGRAASIELYLGRHNLLDRNHCLIPVRWSGYLAAVGQYQGAIENKGAVHRAFEADMAACTDPVQARRTHPELVAIWEQIFLAARQR